MVLRSMAMTMLAIVVIQGVASASKGVSGPTIVNAVAAFVNSK